ncbi:hypothetical protein H2248_001724 [Termitomyces sp. 'cryptogamus']|nr:hypothetical protein H2248_001724 [Termitomyces sp. 'cryptogamus']
MVEVHGGGTCTSMRSKSGAMLGVAVALVLGTRVPDGDGTAHCVVVVVITQLT